MSRTIAIGDIHGCADEFEELLDALNIGPEDRVIQLGDLVNHGPHSQRVLELARAYKIEAILGNHELRLLNARRNNNDGLLKDYDKPTFEQLSEEDWVYLEALPDYIYDAELESIFVHAGFLPNEDWRKQPTSVTTQIQVIDPLGQPAKRSRAPESPVWADYWKGPPYVIYGHTPRPKVYKTSCSLGIDTGCVYGGRLTAYDVEAKTILQVRARKAYARSRHLTVSA